MTGRPTTWATNGVVASPHYLASQAGLRVLQEGGNAVDAAIAANAVLNVVYPHQCHAGGDLFAIVWHPGERKLYGLNASGPAPAGLTIDYIRERGHDAIPERGGLTVTVPGAVAGWAALQHRFGARSLDRVLDPAVGYARDGAPMPRNYVAALSRLADVVASHPGMRAVFGGSASRPGDIMRQPALARTLERVGIDGPRAFYQGEAAEDMVATLQDAGSPMTLDDLAAFEPEWVEPISTSYRGYEVVEMPPNTQGPAVLLMANIVEGLPVADLGHITGAGIHAWVETKLQAFAHRDRYVADPRMVDPAVEQFLDKSVAARMREAIDMEQTSAAGGDFQDGDTIYLCVVDRDGMAVSLIQSVYNNFGSGVLAQGAGVLFHNRGRGFSMDSDHLNSLQPGKRPYHTLIPAMLMRDGEPAWVFGTMGADAQAQVQLQMLLGMVDFGLEPQAVIETPRWVSGADADRTRWVRVEPRAGQAAIADLRDRGHNVVVGEEWDSAMGHAHCILIDRERGVLGGASDPRADGIAAGW
ncbi:MAG TPA: gamma-glutamyltransferase [Thermomicrobiales bacterium]|mgnify:CR=1 FL=1|nr:gamma-glutamyltransferase [Thermomicrobiales bacterium]